MGESKNEKGKLSLREYQLRWEDVAPLLIVCYPRLEISLTASGRSDVLIILRLFLKLKMKKPATPVDNIFELTRSIDYDEARSVLFLFY